VIGFLVVMRIVVSVIGGLLLSIAVAMVGLAILFAYGVAHKPWHASLSLGAWHAVNFATFPDGNFSMDVQAGITYAVFIFGIVLAIVLFVVATASEPRVMAQKVQAP
jgi:hypothetical protein